MHEKFEDYDKAGRLTRWDRAGERHRFGYNLNDELVQAERYAVAGGALLGRETRGLDDAGNWLSRGRTGIGQADVMETRDVNSLNQLTRIGGAGSVVVEGTVNEAASVTVSANGQSAQPAALRLDVATGTGYRFSRQVSVAAGTNSVSISATDQDHQTAVRSWSLLDRTMVFFSSNLGNASTHSTKSLPVLLAGGGFRHGQHLAFDAENPVPLCNLYVSVLQRLGIEMDRFSSATGTVPGLEPARS